MIARLVRKLAALAIALPAASVCAQPLDGGNAFVLVATNALRNSNYQHTVILAIPTEGDRHIGVILNRPTQRHLSELFPEHEPSKKVTDPVFFGGPMSQQAIFALAQRTDSPGAGSIRMMEDVFLALTALSVDRIIEETPQKARFFVGAVIWRPGELRQEVLDRYWYVMNAHEELLFRKETRGLWEELTRLAHALTANAGFAPDALLHRGRTCCGPLQRSP